MSKSSKAKTRYWNLMYWLVRFRSGFTALILLAAAIFAYQYYQVLAEPILENTPQVISNETVSITLFVPNKFSEDKLPESIKLFEIQNKAKEEAPISVSVFRNNEEIHKEEFSLDETNSRTISIPEEKLFPEDRETDASEVMIQINSGNEYLSIEKDILIEHPQKNLFVLASAIISFLTGFFGIINQVKTLTKK